MTPERWRQIEEVFQAVVELAPEERAVVLDRACDGDSDLRREVESLLAKDDGQETILPTVISAVAESLSADGGPDFIGRRIGPYRITGLIGHGGMAEVFRAVRADDQYQQQVAIKLIKRGMVSDFMLSRFRHERQILANLDHPHIARLLDGGTTEDGLPYLVMEYIEGEPITDYCAKNKLSTKRRLRLFGLVCAAVQHAHRNLIIHRDLKPGNILVTKDGAPKLLDFGIAKLLDPDRSSELTQTATGLRMMTPDYASPEQVRGQAVTTATDIYSLGAVLFELLTDQRAHQFKDQSVVEIERVICHQEPERPSSVVSRDMAMVRGLRFLVSGPWHRSRDRTQRIRDKLRRELTGDLDNIVLMAMRKEPGRRYQSVEQFAEDLCRYLDGEPVTARQDTLGYRVGKFVRRNKFPVAAVALIMLSLVGGIVMTARQARRAEQRFEEVRKLANTFLFDVHDKIKELPGATDARELVVTTALGYLDSLARDTEGDRSLQLELARAYEKVGDVQGGPGGASLGQAAAALQSYRKALEIEEKLAADDPMNLDVLRSLSNAHYKVGDQQMTTGQVTEAIESFRRGLSVATTVHEAEPDDPESDYLLIEGYLRLGEGQVTSRDVAGALQSFQTGLTIITHMAGEQASDRTQMLLAVGRERVGSILTVMGDLSGALTSYRQALAIRETLFSNQPTNPTHRRNLVAAYQHMGDVLGSPGAFSLGDERGALEYYRKALVIAEEVATADPKDAAVRHNLAVLYTKLGNVLRDGDPRQGVEMYRISLDLMKPLLDAAPEDLLLHRSQSRNYLQLAYPLWKLGDYQGAMARLRQALDMQEAMIAKDPARKTTHQDMLVSFNMMGDVKRDMNDPAAALASYRKALAIAETLFRENPSDSYTRRDLSDCYERLGRFYVGQAASAKVTGASRIQSWREARAWFHNSLSIWNEWTKWSIANAYSARRQQEASRALAECDAALSAPAGKFERGPSKRGKRFGG